MADQTATQTPTLRDGHFRSREGDSKMNDRTATPDRFTISKSIAAEKSPAQKKNLTETEASEQYGMSVHWYRRTRWTGDGPKFIKLGGAVLYPVTELDAFFDARLVKSTSEVSARGH